MSSLRTFIGAVALFLSGASPLCAGQEAQGTIFTLWPLVDYRESPAQFPLAARETGKAVVMAALTAIVGYGSFAFSHYPGLRSIGYASFFGIFFGGLAAITLLPAILVVRRKERTE